MSKVEMLSDIKTVMKAKVEGLRYDNIEEFENEIKQLTTLLRLKDSILLDGKELVLVDKTDDVSRSMIRTEEVNHNQLLEKTVNHTNHMDNDNNIDDDVNDEKTYIFERTTRGGVVKGLENGYFIPEVMVGHMELGHGDELRITRKEENDEKNRYWFEIVSRGSGDNPRRQEYIGCEIEKEAGEYVVGKSYSGTIRLDEAPYSFIISPQDVNTFKIEEGDIVDIAFYKDNPSDTMKVIKKHYWDEEEVDVNGTVEQRKLRHASVRIPKSEISIDRDWAVDKELFRGKRIFVVGVGSRKADYKPVLDELGAEIKHATGDEHADTLSAMIEWCDVAAITTGELSHSASKYTVRECKKKNRCFSSTDVNGIQSLLLCIEDALKKREIKLEKEEEQIS